LNEIKYDYVDSKQHFYPQYHAAATNMKALHKKQTTLEAVAYFGFPVLVDKLSLGLPPGMWKRSFFCGSGSAKILPLPLP